MTPLHGSEHYCKRGKVTPTMSSKKLILVIGATGAQGIAVINALLAPSADGTPSPYAVRALTRDTESRRAKELAAKDGVETFKGKCTAPTANPPLRPIVLTAAPLQVRMKT